MLTLQYDGPTQALTSDSNPIRSTCNHEQQYALSLQPFALYVLQPAALCVAGVGRVARPALRQTPLCYSLQPYVLQDLVGLHANFFVKLPWRIGSPAHATAALAAQVERNLPTNQPTYLPTYLQTYLHTYQPTYLPTCLPT